MVNTPVCGAGAWVTPDDDEFDRTGDPDRALTKDAVSGGGEGAVSELAESRCLWWEPFGNGEGGAKMEVGVGAGVF